MKKKTVEKVQARRGRPAEELAKIDEAKLLAAIDIREDKKVRAQEKREADKAEQVERDDLIRQIRAMVAVSTATASTFDASEAPDHGLLSQMPLSEVRERYHIMNAVFDRERLQRRDFILDDIEDKKKTIAAKAENLVKIRKIAASEANERYEKRKAEEAAKEKELKKRRAVLEREAEKRQKMKDLRNNEDLRIQKKELKEIEAKRQFLAAGLEMVEANQNSEQMKGLERELKARQRELLDA